MNLFPPKAKAPAKCVRWGFVVSCLFVSVADEGFRSEGHAIGAVFDEPRSVRLSLCLTEQEMGRAVFGGAVDEVVRGVQDVFGKRHKVVAVSC